MLAEEIAGLGIGAESGKCGRSSVGDLRFLITAKSGSGIVEFVWVVSVNSTRE